MKLYGIFGYNPHINRLDFGGNPDLDRDPRVFFEGIFHCVCGPSSWVRQQSKTCMLADLKLSKLNAALAKVCALRVVGAQIIRRSFVVAGLDDMNVNSKRMCTRDKWAGVDVGTTLVVGVPGDVKVESSYSCQYLT